MELFDTCQQDKYPATSTQKHNEWSAKQQNYIPSTKQNYTSEMKVEMAPWIPPEEDSTEIITLLFPTLKCYQPSRNYMMHPYLDTKDETTPTTRLLNIITGQA